MTRSHLCFAIAFTAFCCLASSCGSVQLPQSTPARVVSVRVQLPKGETSPPGAELSIRVVEVSGPDRAVIGLLNAPGVGAGGGADQLIEVRPDKIREDQTYGLEVAIAASGRAIFMNKKPAYVLTKGNPDNATVLLQRVP